MKKTLLLFLIGLSGFALKAQTTTPTQTQITFTASADPVYANDGTITFTAQGENNTLAVDMEILPYSTMTAIMITPNNQGYAGSFALSNITRGNYYNGSTGVKSSFTAKVNTGGFGADATVKFLISVTFVNVQGLSFSTRTLATTINTKPGTTPPLVYYSAAYSKSFTRNNCGAGYQGTSVSLGVSAGQYTSTVSQAAANQAAVNYVNANGQNYANTNGGCNILYSSIAYSGSFTKNDCGFSTDVPSAVPFSLAAGSKTSIISQADANAKALALFNEIGQLNANELGTCTIDKIKVSYSNAAYAGSKITRMVVKNTSGVIKYDFNETALIAGTEIAPGLYNIELTTVGPIANGTVGWKTLLLFKSQNANATNTQIIEQKTNTGGTNYVFSNVNLTTGVRSFGANILFFDL